MEEQVDIVDAEGRILYQASKQDAHEKGLLHCTVISEVINSRGKWLMVKQSSTRQDAGQYVSPVGGHVHAGESFDDALKRETFEELGLKEFEYKNIGTIIFNRLVLGRRENHMFIVYEVYTDQQPVLNEEGESFAWFTKKELREQLTHNPKRFGGAFFPILKKFYPELLG